MVRPEQLRNNIIVSLICLLWTGCYSTTKDHMPATAEIILKAYDGSIRQHADKIFYGDSLLNGTVYDLYESGDTSFAFHYKNGMQDGWQQKWYADEAPAELRYYENGRKEGTHYAWWENGNRKFEYHFAHDEHEGLLKEWFENGTLAKQFHYAAGHENGNQRTWWPDGSVRANYDVKEGKRYGLIGEKLCSNSINYAKN